MVLSELNIGKSAKIISVNCKECSRESLLSMGLIRNTIITVKGIAPLGDPIRVNVRGYELAFRLEDAKDIVVRECL